RLLIALSPLTLEISAFEVVKELFLCKRGIFFNEFVFLEQKRNSRHLGNYAADGVPESTHGQIDIGEYIFQFNAVGGIKSALQDRLRDLKSDEIVICVRGVAILCDLHYIEPELGPDVRP